MSHRIFIITGEPSGDLHGSNLVKELLSQDPALSIACWGGDRMRSAGAEVLKHVDDLAFMGFVEVAANLRTILKNFDLCVEHIQAFQPDLVVLMDYPGFNLRMAKRIKKMGIPVAYYISPQIWAWKESRVEKIKRYVDHVFVILPFEKAFYEKHGVSAEFVGHPLLDEIKHIEVDGPLFRKQHGLSDRPIIALLPGSRKQEISLLLEPIAKIIASFPAHQFVVSKVAWQPEGLYHSLPDDVVLLEGNTYDLLALSEAAIVTSGTATLETALIGTPQVVVYKANPISVLIARWLVKVKFISLVNLIMDKEVVKELIQAEVNSTNLTRELGNVVKGGERREAVLASYGILKEKLGQKGASRFVASRLLKIIAD
ncbi:MAG: lipid-A-disaccharide synthase [Flavobacteriales bacterium]|nr:lipid-A-disaccharide synthase [Flavobacteriales bacterium]